MSKSKKSEIDEERLIEMVHDHHILYDITHPKYKDANVKDLAWKSIANHIGKSGK